MSENKTYYKMKLIPSEEGLSLWVTRWICLRETEHIAYCVPESVMTILRIRARQENQSLYDAAKKEKYCRRIHKTCSRIAFPTEQKAFENLSFLKRRQLNHLKRDQVFIERFLEDIKEKTIADFPPDEWGHRVLPETEDLVHDYYCFD